MIVICPQCGRRLKTGDNLSGKKVSCPACHKPFVVSSKDTRSSDSHSVEDDPDPSANLVIGCPECKRRLRVSQSLAGKRVKCNACQHSFVFSEPITRIADVGKKSNEQQEDQQKAESTTPKQSVPNKQAPASILKQSHTKPAHMEPVSSFQLLTYIAFVILAWFISFLPRTSTLEGLHSTGNLIRIVSVILHFVLLHRIWAMIQIGNVRATPGMVVGFLFIPFYNLYWIFQVYWGWAIDFNRILDAYDLKKPRMSEILGLLASIVYFAFFAVLFLMIRLASDEITSETLFWLVCIYILQGSGVCVHMLFFWKASKCADFLAEKFNAGDITPAESSVS